MNRYEMDPMNESKKGRKKETATRVGRPHGKARRRHADIKSPQTRRPAMVETRTNRTRIKKWGRGRSQKFHMLEMGSTESVLKEYEDGKSTQRTMHNGYKIVQNKEQWTEKEQEFGKTTAAAAAWITNRKPKEKQQQIPGTTQERFWLKEELLPNKGFPLAVSARDKGTENGQELRATEPIPTSSPISSPTWMER